MYLKKCLALLLPLASSFNSFSQTDSLTRTVQALDSTFFHAYNTCDLRTQERLFAASIEFFHDKSGLDTSKANILANTKKYICGKVRRELVAGSIEVSPLPGYGAVELGMHRFHNLAEGSVSRASRFMIIWQQQNGNWTITKVISLH
jgi:hypothetical protein